MWSLDAIVDSRERDDPSRGEADVLRPFPPIRGQSKRGNSSYPLKGSQFRRPPVRGRGLCRSLGGSSLRPGQERIADRSPGDHRPRGDTNQALLDLARFKRERTAGTFIAITGSNGKTTTKELLVHLAGDLFPLLFNEKNYNNQVGVAKTILAIGEEPKFGIFELGTNHKGEIEVLSRMVQPHISLITNVNPSHLEGLSDLEGVRREKLSLFEATQAGGTLFINLDDPSLASYVGQGRP